MIVNIHQYDDVVRNLKLIQGLGFRAILAGGAVRDLYFNVMPRDIDVFIQVPAKTTLGTDDWLHPDKGKKYWAETMQLHFPPKGRNRWHGDDNVEFLSKPNYSAKEIVCVWDVMKDRLPFQLILIDMHPVDFVETRFNIGLCRAYCDGVKFRYTREFMFDVRNQYFSIIGKDMSQAEYHHTREKHIPRIQTKYPGFTVKTAPHNKHLLDTYNKR